MANSKKPQKNTNNRKPSGKKTAPRKRAVAKKNSTKRLSVKPQKNVETTTVRFIPENGEDAQTFTWVGKAWSSATQAGDPAAKAFRDFFHKTMDARKEIRIPENVARRIFDSVDFRWYSDKSTSPEKNKQPTKKAAKPSTKSSPKAKSGSKTAKSTAKSGTKKSGTKRPPRKG